MSEIVNIALPKGRLGEKAYEIFESAGYACPAIREANRKLVFENDRVRYFWVKPADVAIYVERGAADIGVVGSDVLRENAPDVYELLDLGIGKCRMAVAAPKGFRDNPSRMLRVATKFPHTAATYYAKCGRLIDVIKLHGSIELAPLLGMSDVIVDIVETGKTLLENNMEPIADVAPVSARLIANKAAFRFKNEEVTAIQQSIAGRLQ